MTYLRIRGDAAEAAASARYEKEIRAERVFSSIEVVDHTAERRESCFDFDNASSITKMTIFFGEPRMLESKSLFSCVIPEP